MSSDHSDEAEACKPLNTPAVQHRNIGHQRQKDPNNNASALAVRAALVSSHPHQDILLGTKASCVLHGVFKLGLELTEGAVGRQVEAVEAGVRLGQVVGVARLFDGKSTRTVAPLQILEASNWNLGCASLEAATFSINTQWSFFLWTHSELQQSTLLLCGPRANSLPEPLNDLVGASVRAVVGVSHPIVDVDLSNTANEQLQLTFVKDVDEFLRYELVEAEHEGVELVFHTSLNAPLGDETVVVAKVNFIFKESTSKQADSKNYALDIFSLVLLGNWDVSATRLKVGGDNLSKLVVFYRERVLNHIGNIVLSAKMRV